MGGAKAPLFMFAFAHEANFLTTVKARQYAKIRKLS